MKKTLSGVLFILALSCVLIFTASKEGEKRTETGESQESGHDMQAETVKNKNTALSEAEESSAGTPKEASGELSADTAESAPKAAEKAPADSSVQPSQGASGNAPADASTDASGEFYEEVPAPDFEELGVTRAKEDGLNYNVDAYDGKIYVSGGGLQVTVEGKAAPVILVYDEKTEKWGTLQATFLSVEQELQTVFGDGKLYFLSNSGDKLNIFAYDLDTKEVKKFSSIESGQYEIERSLVYDGEYLWMIGGNCQDPESQKWEPSAEIKRINLNNGKIETKDMKLGTARAGAVAELVDGKIIVTGGENADGEWESTTEVIDCEKETVTKAASFPEEYKSRKYMTSVGVFDKSMIIAGVYSGEESEEASEGAAEEDTLIYDSEADQWTTLPQKVTDAELLYSEGAVSGEYFYVFGTVKDGEDLKDIFCRVKIPEDTETAEEDTGANVEGSTDTTGKSTEK